MSTRKLINSLILILIVLASFYFIYPYAICIALALISAHAWAPIYDRIRKRFNNDLASIISTGLFLLVIVLPLFLVGVLVISQIRQLVGNLDLNSSEHYFQAAADRLNELAKVVPVFETQITAAELRGEVNSFLDNAANWLAGSLFPLTNYLLNAVTQIILFLIVFSTALVEEKKLLKYIYKVAPLKREVVREYLRNIYLISMQMLKSTFLVALAQGALTLLALLLLRVDLAVFLSVLTTFTSILPIGAGAVLFPLGILLIFAAESGKGIAVLIFAFILVNVIENALRPRFAAENSPLPQALILIGILCGIYLWGFAGIILGPVFLGVVKTTLDIGGDII
jgi:predicted PurR-regulated permease PerM